MPQTKKERLIRAFECLAVLLFIELFVCNIKWIEYRLLSGHAVRFSLSPVVAAAFIVLPVCAYFLPELQNALFRLDGHAMGGGDLSPFAGARVQYENIFVAFALLFGLVFIFVIPPMFAPDETNHFTRAYLLANGQLMPEVNSSGDAVGYVRRELRSFLGTWNAGTWSPGKKTTLRQVSELFSGTVTRKPRRVEVAFPYPYLSFFMYIPQALGIFLGSLLFDLLRISQKYNIYMQMLAARAANLICYVVCLYFSIRLTPFFKRTLTVLALTPMAIFIASSCSYDVFMYSFCILYLALILNFAYDPGISRIGPGRTVALIILQFFILLGKYVYFPLLFLIFLIPKKKFGTDSRIKILLKVALPSLALLCVWLLAYKFSIRGLAADQYSGAYHQQAVFVLSHPIKYIAILASNLAISGKVWATGFVGLFGWLNVPIPMPFVIAYIVFLLCSAVFETVANQSTLSRPLLGAVSVACYILVATAEYVVWTPSLGHGGVGQYTIIGIQGRYFIPFAFPLLLILANSLPYRTYLFGKGDILLNRFSKILLGGSLIFALFFLLKCYWLP